MSSRGTLKDCSTRLVCELEGLERFRAWNRAETITELRSPSREDNDWNVYAAFDVRCSESILLTRCIKGLSLVVLNVSFLRRPSPLRPATESLPGLVGKMNCRTLRTVLVDIETPSSSSMHALYVESMKAGSTNRCMERGTEISNSSSTDSAIMKGKYFTHKLLDFGRFSARTGLRVPALRRAALLCDPCTSPASTIPKRDSKTDSISG